jgi:hypothetical protein
LLLTAKEHHFLSRLARFFARKVCGPPATHEIELKNRENKKKTKKLRMFGSWKLRPRQAEPTQKMRQPQQVPAPKPSNVSSKIEFFQRRVEQQHHAEKLAGATHAFREVDVDNVADGSGDGDDDDVAGCQSEEEELFSEYRARHASHVVTMKTLPGWMKTASLQRCEKTPPLPRTQPSACPLPTAPPRRRRSQSSLSSSLSLSVSSGVAASPAVTPRRRRRQSSGVAASQPSVVRQSVSLHCLKNVGVDEKPELPPKVWLQSLNGLNGEPRVS